MARWVLGSMTSKRYFPEIERIQQMVSPPAPLTLEPKPIHADVFLTCRARMVVVESQGTSGEVPLECVGGLSEGWPMKKVRQTIQCLIFFSSSSPRRDEFESKLGVHYCRRRTDANAASQAASGR